MKFTKRLFIAALLPALIPFFSHADDGNESISSQIWEQAKRALRNSRISVSVNLPTQQLAQGLTFNAGATFQSQTSIAGKYSGVDIWDVNLAAYPELFGQTLPNGISLSTAINRQVTYIQQFSTQRESVFRLPYDPINKLPLNSKKFFEKTKNILTGKEEVALKTGDFIGYRAPMTLSLGKGLGQMVSGHLGLSSGLSYVITGEFDMHVFVMENNFVRVKILASKSKGSSMSAGLSLLGFNGIGQLIVNRLIDTNFIQFYLSQNKTDLFVADYIFNLNSSDARELYDRLVGSKLHIFNINIIKDQILLANPFISVGSTRSKLIADLTELNDVSSEDIEKPYSERRVLKLLNAHNKTNSFSSGLKINLLKIFSTQSSFSKSNSKITIFANTDDKVTANYKLDAHNLSNSFNFLIWGDRHLLTNSLLTQTDFDDKVINFVGLQNTRIREDNVMQKDELRELLGQFSKVLPAAIYDRLEKPEWNFGTRNYVESAYVQQDITFNENLFKMHSGIEPSTIKNSLIYLLKNYGKFKSQPLGILKLNFNNEEDPVMNAYNRGNYVEAYADYELKLIPEKLSIALNSQYSFEERYKQFNFLYESVPLFTEISTALLLKIIPEEELEKVVIARIMMSAKDQKSIVSDYPATELFITRNLFREILGQSSYINDQSYNLRNYIKEDGSLYNINEIMIEKNK